MKLLQFSIFWSTLLPLLNFIAQGPMTQRPPKDSEKYSYYSKKAKDKLFPMSTSEVIFLKKWFVM